MRLSNENNRFGYVYLTINTINGKMYVGIRAKPKFDCSYLGSGTALKRAVKKYGRGSFRVHILSWHDSYLSLSDAERREIADRNAVQSAGYYNITPGGYSFLPGRDNPMSVFPHSEETRKKIRDSAIGRKVSPETRAKLSAMKRGKRLSKHHCRRISQAQLGHVVSAETRRKIGDANRGKKRTDEVKAKLSAASQHLPMSAKNKEALRAANIGRPLSEEHKAKVRLARLGTKMPRVNCPNCGQSVSVAHESRHAAKWCQMLRHPSPSTTFCTEQST